MRTPCKLLERIMISFLNGEIDVLVSTKYYRVWDYVPNANTMFSVNQSPDAFASQTCISCAGRVGSL